MATGKPLSNHGVLVTFEGSDGAGKSTLIRAVEAELKRRKIPVVITREPGGTLLAEKIRHLILEHSMSRETELLLYEAARNEHVLHRIAPALKKGLVVLCDRYTDSSLAYQSAGRGIGWSNVEWLNRFATDNLRPTLTVYLKSEPRKTLLKAKRKTRFEREGVAFQRRVQIGFARAMRLHPQRWVVLQSWSQPPARMAGDVVRRIESTVKKKSRTR